MKDLLEYVVKNLVSNPEEVKIEEEKVDGNLNLKLSVAPEDMGMIIGKNGQTINALRKILTIRAIAENIKVNLQLEDSGKTPQEVKDEQAVE